MEQIVVNHLVKDYGNQKGIFDVSFAVEKGEVFGFLGPNGAGKTTTIRQLMGFIYPDSGECYIEGMNCSKESDKIQKSLGYLPGEIAFMDEMTGIDFIKFMGSMREITDFTYANELMEFFELDPSGRIKKMSKGMKQKLGIVCAFMHDPSVLILDEPTSGLDPLMQNRFVELLRKEKGKGKTILMSSHMFDEVEKTCDRVAIIKEGRLVALDSIANLKEHKSKKFTVTFVSEIEAEKAAENMKEAKARVGAQVEYALKGNMNAFVKVLATYEIVSLEEEEQSLEQVFMQFYGGDNHVK